MEESSIEELQSEIQRLTRLVYYDELTGVFNRRGFLKEAEHIFSLVSKRGAAERRSFGVPLSVVFIDLDNFKVLNDTYGHAAGDEALRVVSTTLRASIRDVDVLGRMGGEELVVALVGVSAEWGAATAEKLRARIEAIELMWEGKRIPLTASLGVAEYRGEGDVRQLIERADQAMYQAKQAGKNRIAVAD